MRFLENLSLYKKLLLSFLIVISLSYVAIFLSINALDTFNNKISYMVDNDIQTLINNLKSRRSVVELQMFEKELFLSANEAEKSKNLFNISTAQEDVAYRFDIISKLSLDPQTSKGVEHDKHGSFTAWDGGLGCRRVDCRRILGVSADLMDAGKWHGRSLVERGPVEPRRWARSRCCHALALRREHL